MNKNLLHSLVAVAFATVCAGQSVVPPQDCASNQPGCPPPPPVPLPAITGSGTPGNIPVFTAPNSIGNSVISQSPAGAVGIGGGASGNAKLGVTGNINATGNITATGQISTSGVILQSGNVSASQDVTAINVKASSHVSASQYDIGSEQVLATPGSSNSFVGVGAGKNNTGSSNAFFGTNAGTSNAGNNNAAFGVAAGFSNTLGSNNALFGAGAGQFNSQGSGNAFFGTEAGLSNNQNENSFFGHSAGKNFSGGSHVTLQGAGTTAVPGVHHATAVGSLASVVQSNTMILGGVDDTAGAVDVGIGTNTPHSRLEIRGGDIYLGSGGRGVILKTTTGQHCARLVVNDQGQVSGTIIACP